MVSRIWITYLKYDSQSEENEPERTWHQPQSWSFYLPLERTSYSGSYVPTIKFDLEQLPPTRTSGNGPVSCKKSCYRIRVSLTLCLSFWLFTFIYLEIGHWKRKKNLLDLFLSCLVILQNVYPCIKHNNLFYYICHHNYHKSVSICFPVTTPCYFRRKVLGLTCVGIDLLITIGTIQFLKNFASKRIFPLFFSITRRKTF